MARIRNVSDHTLELRYAGRLLGVAEPDGVLTVPDDLYASLAWPESLWQAVAEPRTSNKEK